jgi:hypothetical protein
LWVPRIRAAAKAAGIADFPIFGEVTLNDAVDLSEFVRDRGLPQALDFPFQQVAAAYAAGASGARGLGNRLTDDDYFRTANGVDPAFTTFLGNHDMGRAAEQILRQAGGLSGNALTQHVLLGYDVLYLLRGAPAVLYGDEVGMIGSGGDQQARQDMFPTLVGDWQTQTRVGGPPIGSGSSLGIVNSPIEAQLRTLSALRDAFPALSTGASVVRQAKDAVLVVSRIDFARRQEVVVAFNNGDAPVRVTVPTATPGATWSVAFGTGGASGSAANLTLTIPPVSAVVAVPGTGLPKSGLGKAKLATGSDDLTSLYRLGATVSGGPASVVFAIRRRNGAWHRVAIDDSAPYRAFLEPGRFKKRERVAGVAVAEGTVGTVAAAPPVTFVPNP